VAVEDGGAIATFVRCNLRLVTGTGQWHSPGALLWESDVSVRSGRWILVELWVKEGTLEVSGVWLSWQVVVTDEANLKRLALNSVNQAHDVYRCVQSYTAHCLATSFDLAYPPSSGRLYKNNNAMR